MTDFGPAIRVTWNGETLSPSDDRWLANARRQLDAGESYLIREHAERSTESHNHFFACVSEAWKNLPESHAGMPYSYNADNLRKHALIMAGYANTTTFVCASKAEAQRLAGWVNGMGDEYAIISINEAMVIRKTAQSQSRKAMGNSIFQESKNDVLEFCADLINVDVDELTKTTKETA